MEKQVPQNASPSQPQARVIAQSGTTWPTPTSEAASPSPEQQRKIPDLPGFTPPSDTHGIDDDDDDDGMDDNEHDTNDISDMNSFDILFPPHGGNNNVQRNKYGISYSPYNAGGGCKGQHEVDDDIKKLRQYSLIRIYGVDCNQARTVTKAARENKMKVFAGVFNIANLDQDLQEIIEAADGDWSLFHTISVGNELVNRAQNSAAEVAGSVNAARDTLRQAGYQGPVVTVDTFNQLIEHPELCEASDYCAANCHAFFDATQTPENAGQYVRDQARLVSQAAGGKKVIITESGWPYAGVPNGNAIPSRSNQEAALRSLQKSFPDGGLILFSAFDDMWKTDNAGTFSTEKFWGITELGDMIDFR